MPNAIWNEKEKRWKLRVRLQGKGEKVFSSNKPGKAGKQEVSAAYSAWLTGTPAIKLTFEKIYEKFLADIRARLSSNSVLANYGESVGRVYLIPEFGSRDVNSLTLWELQEFVNELRLQNGEMPSKKYLSNIVSILTRFLKFCYERSYLDLPLRGSLYVPAERPVRHTDADIPTADDIQRLCEPSGIWTHELICFLALSGMRPGEALGLLRDDLDLNARTVKIRQSININNVVTKGKTKNATRTVALSSAAVYWVKKAIAKEPDSEYVFCRADGTHETYRAISSAYIKLQRQRNIPGSLYSLRHFYITQVRDRLTLEQVKSEVGHSASMPTYDVYGHDRKGDLPEISTRLDGVFDAEKYSRHTFGTPDNSDDSESSVKSA